MILLPPRSTRTYPPFPYTTLFRSVAGEDGHHGFAEETVLQPAPAEGPVEGDGGRRPASGKPLQDRRDARRARAGRGGDEPPPGGARPFAERPAAHRWRRRMAGLAGRRDGEPGDAARSEEDT